MRDFDRTTTMCAFLILESTSSGDSKRFRVR